MKSLFRRPTDSDSSSASSSSSDGDAESSLVSQDPGGPSSLPQAVPDSTKPEISAGTTPPAVNPLTMYSSLLPDIPLLPQNHHHSFLVSSLLETYIKSRVPNNPALAEHLYTSLAQRLPELGIIPKNSEHFARPELASVRQGYLDGIDGLLQQTLEKDNDENRRTYASGSLAGGGGQMTLVKMDSAKPTLRRIATELSISPDTKKVIHRSSSLSVLANAAQSAKYRPNTAPNMPESPPDFFGDSPSAESPSQISILLPPRYSRYTSDFVEVKFLGRGGFGSVYHVRNRLDNADYAVKKVVLKNKMFQRIHDGGVEAFNRILSEVQTMAKLEHGNIVRYYGGWIEGLVGEPFITPIVPVKADAGVEILPAVPVLSEGPDSDVSPEAVGVAENGDETDIFAFSDLGEENRVRTLEDSTTGSQGIMMKTISRDNEMTDEEDSEEEDSEDSVELIPRSYPPRVKLATSHPKPRPQPNGRWKKSAKAILSSESGISGSDLFSAGDGALIKSHPRPHGKGHNRTSSAPIVTLHIQMSLHPLVLTSYLSSSQTGEKHCFCVRAGLGLFLGLVDGVSYLHLKGIAHRDLKPGNVFLDIAPARKSCGCVDDAGATVVPRIGDFGLVKPIEETAGTTAAKHGNPGVGTEFYRPPVGMADEYDVVGRDLFALGVMLVEFLYKFGTRMERVHILSKLTRSGELPKGFDERVAELVKGCCGLGQHRWDLERVRKTASDLMAAEFGHQS